MTGLALVRLFLERLRTERASTLALAAFVLATAFLFGLGPRLLAATADDVLRTTVGANPVADRNVAFDEQTRIRAGAADDPFEVVEEEGDALQAQLPDALAPSFVDRVASADSTRWSVVSATGAGTIVTIRFEPRAFDRLRLVAGRWPGPSDRTVVVPGTGTDPELRAPVYEAALVEASATKIGVHVGDLVLLRPDRRDPQAASLPMAAAVEVVGTYAPSDPADPFWYGEAALLRPTIRAISNEVQFTDVFALAAPAAYPRYVEATSDLGAPLRYRWRVQLDPARLDAATVGRVEAGLRRLETSLPASAYATGGAVVSSRLVDILGGEEAQWRSALAVLVVMATGPVAIAVAAFGLVALLGAGRRRATTVLWRARGASRLQLLASVGAEALLVVAPPALLGGALAAAIVPLADGTGTWLAVALVALAAALVLLGTVAPGAVDALGSRGPASGSVGARRQQHGGSPLGPRRRVVAEALVVVGAVASAWLLRERSVHGSGGAGAVALDPLVALAPVLAGAAAGIVAVRLVPLAMSLVATVAAGGRGLVTVLGLRRATRGTAGAAVLLVLLATAIVGTFSSAALVQLDRSATAIAWHDVGAPFRISSRGGVIGPGLDDRSLAAAGATASVGAYRSVATAGSVALQVQVLALDPDAYERLVSGLPVDAELPAALRAPAAPGARPANGPGPALPALASSALVASPRAGVSPGSTFTLLVDGRQTSLQVVAVDDAWPTLDPGVPWVVISRPQLEAARGLSIGTTDLFVRAPDAAAGALGRLVEERSSGVEVASRAAAEAALRASPIVRAVSLGVAAAALVAAAYAALAVVAALALAAASRTAETGILRTFGLTRRDALGLVVAEHGPTVGIAFALGVSSGLGLFLALRPGLGLAGVVGSALDVPLAVEPLHLVLLIPFVALVAVAGIAIGAAIERRVLLATVVRRGVE